MKPLSGEAKRKRAKDEQKLIEVNWDNLALKYGNMLKKSEVANSLRLSIYTNFPAFRGISYISSFELTAATIESSLAKHQIFASSS